jgi:pimeloyl-ACP methyl ester carboxylesterase
MTNTTETAVRKRSRLPTALKNAAGLILLLCSIARAEEPSPAHHIEPPPLSEKMLRFDFHGFPAWRFQFEGVAAIVVAPHQAAAENPWVWRARFWAHQPQFDRAMLEKGYHIAYCDIGGLFGAPAAVERWNRFHALLTQHGLHPKPFLEGMSRGGLIIFNWAKANPDKVSGIYGDNPVCDIKSWPGGFGAGKGAPREWEQCLAIYNLTPESAKTFAGNPIDGLDELASRKIPIILVVGEADEVVPVAENADILASRYIALGGPIEVIRKPGLKHHPHSLPDPTPLVEFALKAHRTPASTPR